MQFFFSSWHHLTQPFFSFLANANQEATHRVIQAVVADHGGTGKCPWSSAEMKGNYTCRSLLLLTAMQPSYMYVIVCDVRFIFKCELTIQISTPALKFAVNSAFDVTNIVLLMTVSLQQACELVTDGKYRKAF